VKSTTIVVAGAFVVVEIAGTDTALIEQTSRKQIILTEVKMKVIISNSQNLISQDH
jgi:hypothetical protein